MSSTAIMTPGGAPTPAAAVNVKPGRSPSQIAFERLRADKVAVISFFVVIFFIVVAIFAPFIVIAIITPKQIVVVAAIERVVS